MLQSAPDLDLDPEIDLLTGKTLKVKSDRQIL